MSAAALFPVLAIASAFIAFMGVLGFVSIWSNLSSKNR